MYSILSLLAVGFIHISKRVVLYNSGMILLRLLMLLNIWNVELNIITNGLWHWKVYSGFSCKYTNEYDRLYKLHPS